MKEKKQKKDEHWRERYKACGDEGIVRGSRWMKEKKQKKRTLA